MTLAQLKARTAKDLAQIAKRKGISRWHSMRKEELVDALARHFKTQAVSAGNGCHNGKKACAGKNGAAKHAQANGQANGKANGKPVSNGKAVVAKAVKPSAKVERRLKQIKEKLAQSKDLAFHPAHTQDHVEAEDAVLRDRLVVMVRDPYWLHAYWELTRPSIERARAALGPNWHGAKPVLRVLELAGDGTTSSVRKVVRNVEIHGGVNNWYVDVENPPKSYQLEIGYLALDGKFVSLARSNVVSTPPAGALKTFDGNWTDTAGDFDRIYALSGGYSEEGDHSDLKDLFEQRLRRPMGSPMVARFGRVCGDPSQRDFAFEVDAELIVFGVTEPNAHLTIRGEPVKVGPDGAFSMRFHLPDRRQVLPVVACSGDGVEQRTIVLAIERNTKIMEPVLREMDS